MPYDASKDLLRSVANTPNRLGRRGANVVLSGDTNLDPYSRIWVTAAGTLSVLPVENADGAWVDCGSPGYGFIVPYEVRAIKGTSTASVATI